MGAKEDFTPHAAVNEVSSHAFINVLKLFLESIIKPCTCYLKIFYPV